MNRQIKFRVWDTASKRWCNRDTDGFIFNITTLKEDLGDRFIAQQYTGFNDFTGKELCEGDIVEILYRSINRYRPVNYNDGRKELTIDCNSIHEFIRYNEIRIVGNVFETPDLLV